MPDEKNNVGDFYRAKQDAGIGLSEDGRPQYGEMAEAGMERLVLPAPAWGKDSGRISEDVLAKDLPRHIGLQIQRTFEAGGLYSKANAHQVLGHYRGVLKGAQLADASTLRRLEKLQDGLAKADDPKEYFTKEIRPFLGSLRPGKRT